VETLPNFAESDRGDQEIGWILRIMPEQQSWIWPRLCGLADRIGVQHPLHRTMRLTSSSGMRGGSQSVLKRTESCHFLICNFDRAVRRGFRGRGLIRFAGLNCRFASQCSNSRASGGESCLTFSTATSTALIVSRVAGKFPAARAFRDGLKPPHQFRTAAN
jgi:hypothetical protein